MGAVMQTVSRCEIDAGEMGSWAVDVALPTHEELSTLNTSVRNARDSEARQAIIMDAMPQRIRAVHDLTTEDGAPVIDARGLSAHAGFFALSMMRAFVHVQERCAGVLMAGSQKNLQGSSTP